MESVIKTLLAVYLLCLQPFNLQRVIPLPRSPCPGVFTYNATSLIGTGTQIPDRWFGKILIKADTTLSGFWIDVELDKTAHLLGNYLAEVTSSDNREFKIQDLDRRLVKGSITPIKIYVKYDPSSLPPPAVKIIRLNGRQICPPEHEEEILDGEPVRTVGLEDTNFPNRPQTSTHRIQNVYQNNKRVDEPAVGQVHGGSETVKKNQNSKSSSTYEVNSNPKTVSQNVHQTNKPTVYDDGGIRTTSTQTQNSHKISQSNIAQSSYEDTSSLQRGTSKFQTNKGQQIAPKDTLNYNPHQQEPVVGSVASNEAYRTTPPPARTLSTMSINHNIRNTHPTRQETDHRVTQPTRPTIPERNNQDNLYQDSNIRGSGISNSHGIQPTNNRGTQTSHSQYDDDYRNSERGSNRQQSPNYGSSDVYSNRDRTPARDPVYDNLENERVGVRGSEPEFTDPRVKDRDRDNGFRGNPDRNQDFDNAGDRRRVGSNQNTKDWDDVSGTRRGSQPNYNDREQTTVYTSLDSHIQRPGHVTTERYPITPHPSSQFRPGHTPLSNSNSRPSEPSSDDYYEWGVRKTSSKRTQLPAPQPNTNRQPEQCGKVAIQPVALISRGTPTKSGDYPWHAAIYRPEGIDLRYICGATLVSLSTLVTAAHCVTRQSTGRAVKPDSLVVYLGKHSLRRWTGNEQTATVSEVIVHPAYNHTAFQADLALLKLSTPVTYNDYVRPVCLWDRRRKSIESVVARRGTVVGWGYDEYQVVTDELMQAQMPVVPKLDCIHSYPTFFSRFVTDLTYCAGFRNGTTACNGDSGGGMVFLEEPLGPEDGDDGVWRLRGVVSIGVSITDQFVCDYNHYIVFTDVAQFLPWLENNM